MIGGQSCVAIGGAILTLSWSCGALPVFESLFLSPRNLVAGTRGPESSASQALMIEAPARISTARGRRTSPNPPPRRAARSRDWPSVLVFSRHRKAREARLFHENIAPRPQFARTISRPTMSALHHIAHVKEGVDLALKNGLKQQIIDVIPAASRHVPIYYFTNARSSSRRITGGRQRS